MVFSCLRLLAFKSEATHFRVPLLLADLKLPFKLCGQLTFKNFWILNPLNRL